MKKIAVVVGFALFAGSALAASKSCDELKTEIDAKLQAKGVKAYLLEILPSADVKDQKVVGSCEAGTKKIVYSKS